MPSPLRQRRRYLPGIGLLVGLALLAAGCGGDGQSDEPAGPKLQIDEPSGSVEAVGLGDNAAAIERVFGAAPPYNATEDTTPLGVEPPDLTLSGLGGECEDKRGRELALRYRGVSFFGYGDGICDVLVTSERASTQRGLSPGDPIERVEELHPRLECGETDVSPERPRLEPVCWGRTGEGVYIWIGGDPIDNIGFTERPSRPRP